jgi:hypothetical protein
MMEIEYQEMAAMQIAELNNSTSVQGGVHLAPIHAERSVEMDLIIIHT